MSAKKRGLGRGLDALLATSQSGKSTGSEIPEQQGELQKIPVEFLQPGKYQPRKDMSSEALEDLASSIRSQGIIQPIVVRQISEDRYEIIAGERRWRASQIAQLDVIPCLIKDVPDESAVAIALIENIQREDLNAMEEAQALDRLMVEFDLTHQEVATAVGKSRTTVTNLLRLNNLNDDVKLLLEHGDIEMGHARALLALEGDAQNEAAQIVSGKGLTVRDTENLVRIYNETKQLDDPKPVAKPEVETPVFIKKSIQDFSEYFGHKIDIKVAKNGKGKITIPFHSEEDFNRIKKLVQSAK